MKFARTALYLTISMVVSGFVHAESASLYTQVRKSIHHPHHAKAAGTLPKASSNSVNSAAATTKPTKLDEKTIATILPNGERIVAGDDSEFFILAQDQPDPLLKVDIKAAEVRDHLASAPQVTPVNSTNTVVSLNKPPHVDDILSQIATRPATKTEGEVKLADNTSSHDVVASIPSQEITQASPTPIGAAFANQAKVTPSAAPLAAPVAAQAVKSQATTSVNPQAFVKDSAPAKTITMASAEKNGEVADYHVALDNIFSRVEAVENDGARSHQSIQANATSPKLAHPVKHTQVAVSHAKPLAAPTSGSHINLVATKVKSTHNSVTIVSAPKLAKANNHRTAKATITPLHVAQAKTPVVTAKVSHTKVLAVHKASTKALASNKPMPKLLTHLASNKHLPKALAANKPSLKVLPAKQHTSKVVAVNKTVVSKVMVSKAVTHKNSIKVVASKKAPQLALTHSLTVKKTPTISKQKLAAKSQHTKQLASIGSSHTHNKANKPA